MGIVIRRIAETQVSEELIELVIAEQKLLLEYGVIIQSETDDLEIVDLVVQDMDINKRFQLEETLKKEAKKDTVLCEDIIELVSNILLTKKEGIDNLLLVA